jgi:predicted RNA binding protein YcfA (HicA-like mRNA interferase family)
MNTAAVISAEVVKALLMLAFEEARRRGLSEEEMVKLYHEEREKFIKNDPVLIPEV